MRLRRFHLIAGGGWLRLLRTPARLAIFARSNSFCRCDRPAASLAALGCHPALRTQQSLDQGRHVNVRIDLREMHAQARWRNLDDVEIGWCRFLETLRQVRRKRQVQASIERDEDPCNAAIVKTVSMASETQTAWVLYLEKG